VANIYTDPRYFETLARRTIELERIQFASDYEIDAEVLAMRTDLHTAATYAGNQLARIYHHVYGRRSSQVVEYPATWLDAFKLRFFPAWALKRWPAELTRVEVHAQALFPDVVADRRRDRVMLYVTDEPARLESRRVDSLAEDCVLAERKKARRK
jgi:hypothetical protein